MFRQNCFQENNNKKLSADFHLKKSFQYSVDFFFEVHLTHTVVRLAILSNAFLLSEVSMACWEMLISTFKDFTKKPVSLY